MWHMIWRVLSVNAIHLMAQGRDDSRWMTYKQAAAAGAQVRKGEKGTPVQYWKFSAEQDKRDDQAGRRAMRTARRSRKPSRSNGRACSSLTFSTVAAFDSGNLLHVARALHEKYPDKPIIIVGDDDKAQEVERGYNPGRAKAEEAAKAVGGKAIFPIFAPGEQSGNPKGFTDLATKSELGREGVQRQVNTAVGKVLVDVGQQEKAQKIDQEQKQEQRPRRAARIG